MEFVQKSNILGASNTITATKHLCADFSEIWILVNKKFRLYGVVGIIIAILPLYSGGPCSIPGQEGNFYEMGVI